MEIEKQYLGKWRIHSMELWDKRLFGADGPYGVCLRRLGPGNTPGYSVQPQDNDKEKIIDL